VIISQSTWVKPVIHLGIDNPDSAISGFDEPPRNQPGRAQVILVDTSVWIDHLRTGNEILAALLDAGQVLARPFVTGELALGNLNRRNLVLRAIQDLPQAMLAYGPAAGA